MEFPIFKYYDENNKLVDEYNIHEIWRKEYPDGHLGITHPEDEPNGERREYLLNNLLLFIKNEMEDSGSTIDKWYFEIKYEKEYYLFN